MLFLNLCVIDSWQKPLTKKSIETIISSLAFSWIYYFLDSIRQIIKYNKLVSSSPGDLRNNPQAEVTAKMNLFHAQRNLYISGFSLFLLM